MCVAVDAFTGPGATIILALPGTTFLRVVVPVLDRFTLGTLPVFRHYSSIDGPTTLRYQLRG